MGNELTASHFRVAAIAVALYEYEHFAWHRTIQLTIISSALWTIPAEIAIYREQKSFRRMT